MGAFLDAFKTVKLWQIGVLAAVLIAAAGATYGVYALLSGSGQAGLGKDQQLIPVQYGNLVNQVSTNGSLLFPTRETLTFGTQGTVGEVLVKEGQQVKAGQPLARLDAAAVASLEKAVAQARVSLRNAEDALAKAKNPHTALEIAQAEAAVASARLSLQNARDALARLLEPTSQDTAQAEAAVANAKLSVKNAQEALDGVKNGPTTADLAKAQSQVDSAKTSLANAERDLNLAQKEWDAKVKAASDVLATAKAGYQGVYQKWLGIAVGQEEVTLAPDTLLVSWGVDLTSLFDPNLRFQDIAKLFWAEGPPADDPATPWSESVVYVWLNMYPGPIAPTCEDGVVPRQGACIRKEMNDAWDTYEKTKDSLDAVEAQAAKAIASADSAVVRARDSLATAEEALADLKAGPDPLEVDLKEKQLVVAQANLAKAEEALAKLVENPDPLEVGLKEKQLAVAQGNLAKAEEDLAELKGSVDSLEVTLREADLTSARAALDTALQRLEGATLKAPLAGVVSLVNVVAGQTIMANTTVVEVVDPTLVEVDGVVDEIDVLFVTVGAQANVTMDALPGQVLEGTVSSIASTARSQSGVVSYPISIRVEVPQGIELREGLSATASIVIREERNVLLVPLQALYGTFEQAVVRVMKDGRIEERSVALGSSDDYWAAVRQGLAEGEQVVMQTTQASTSQFGVGMTMRQFQGQFSGAMPGGAIMGSTGGTRQAQATPRAGR